MMKRIEEWVKINPQIELIQSRADPEYQRFLLESSMEIGHFQIEFVSTIGDQSNDSLVLAFRSEKTKRFIAAVTVKWTPWLQTRGGYFYLGGLRFRRNLIPRELVSFRNLYRDFTQNFGPLGTAILKENRKALRFLTEGKGGIVYQARSTYWAVLELVVWPFCRLRKSRGELEVDLVLDPKVNPIPEHRPYLFRETKTNRIVCRFYLPLRLERLIRVDQSPFSIAKLFRISEVPWIWLRRFQWEVTSFSDREKRQIQSEIFRSIHRLIFKDPEFHSLSSKLRWLSLYSCSVFLEKELGQKRILDREGIFFEVKSPFSAEIASLNWVKEVDPSDFF